MKNSSALFLVITLLASIQCFGQNDDAAKDTKDTKSDRNNFFNDGNWGVGLAVINSHDAGQVNDASIRNGIVSVDDVQKWSPKLLLERHYFPHGNWANPDKPTDREKSQCVSDTWSEKLYFLPRMCIGGFIGVGLGSNQIIDFVGAGIIFGFGKASNFGVNNARPHNVGFGVARQFHQKLLADGFSNGSPPPNGATQVEYKYTDTNAFFLFYTYAP
jgi:hypothetical protein